MNTKIIAVAMLVVVIGLMTATVALATKECNKEQTEVNSETGTDTSENTPDFAMDPDKKQGRTYLDVLGDLRETFNTLLFFVS